MAASRVQDQEDEIEFVFGGLDPQIALGKRILIVEDEEGVASYLTDLLTEYRCEVVGPTASGIKAIAIAQTRKPDLALIDIGIPGMLDGISTAIELKTR